MSQLSTLIQKTDSELLTANFNLDYAPLEFNVAVENVYQEKRPISPILLQWTAEQAIASLPNHTFYTQYGKRLVDILIAGLVIVFILSWLIPIVGLFILFESEGPVFFKQARSGRQAKPFRCWKFRTMVHISQTYPFRQTARNDNRVTRLGKFLRRTNLDEMPQFINVFLGDMSLVGPRPHAVPHDAMHWASAAYRERYWIKPGITGLAQVRGSRGATGMTQRMEHRVRYDHLYIPKQAFLLDMKICFKTLKIMFKGDAHAW